MKNDEFIIKLTIRSREGLLFEGDVASLTSLNKVGVFDILPYHTNFISLIYDYIYYVDYVTKISHEIPISRAILKSKGNQVSIFVGM